MQLDKLYYSIGEVAGMFGVSNSLLRYWETEFPAIRPVKNKKGDRRYSAKEIQFIARVYDLVKIKGYTIDGARKELGKKDNYQSKEIKEIILIKLQDVKRRLDQLQEKI